MRRKGVCRAALAGWLLVSVLSYGCGSATLHPDGGGGSGGPAGSGGKGGSGGGARGGTGGSVGGTGGTGGSVGGTGGTGGSVGGTGGSTACTSPAKRCNGLQPQSCDANGTWQNTGAACGG